MLRCYETHWGGGKKKLISGYRGDQLTPPSLKMDYTWLDSPNSKCNSLKSGSASLFPARPRDPSAGRGLPEQSAAPCSRQAYLGLPPAGRLTCWGPLGHPTRTPSALLRLWEIWPHFLAFQPFCRCLCSLPKGLKFSAFFPNSKRGSSESMTLPFKPPALSWSWLQSPQVQRYVRGNLLVTPCHARAEVKFRNQQKFSISPTSAPCKTNTALICVFRCCHLIFSNLSCIKLLKYSLF